MVPEIPPERPAAFRAFLDRHSHARRPAVLCHSDCDGLAAGAILTHALRRAGHAVAVEVTGKGGGAWTDASRAALLAHNPDLLFVADLGCRDEAVLPGVPTLFLDHHRPHGVPDGCELVTGYADEPVPTSGLLALACGATVADVNDLDWIAAISAIGDLGDKAPFALLPAAKKRYGATKLRDATSLLNAPRRTSSGDARPALELLLKSAGPADILGDKFPESDILRAAKAEVSAAFAEAKKVAPRSAGRVALVRVHSGCQVHPMLGPVWKTRLAKQIVIIANTGYLPGRVNFAVRSQLGVNLLDFLAEHAPPDAGENYGKGHDQATGGSLTFPAWNHFIRGLGFGPEALVEVEPAGAAS